MKTLRISMVLIFILGMNSMQAQDAEESKSKINVITYFGIGFGKIENDVEPNYDLNSNDAVILLNYKVWKTIGLATGLGYNQLSGSGFSSEGNFYHDRGLLKIPLLGTFETKISDRFSAVGSFGPYAQTILKDDYRFLLATKKDVYEGWNFGLQLGFGFVYKCDKNISFGVHYTGQSDLSKFETKSSQIVNDKQKIKDMNILGLIFLVDF